MSEPFQVIDDWSGCLELPGAHAIFCGGSGSGKTTLALSLLTNAAVLNPRPKVVTLHYDAMQDLYIDVKRQLAKDGIELQLVKGMGDVKLEDHKAVPYQRLFIYDDLSMETASSPEIVRMVTNARHSGITIWLSWHFIYSKWPESRVISANVPYLFLLPSPRLESQVANLGSQLGMRSRLVEAYNQSAYDPATRYLLVDLKPSTPPALRLRSAIENPLKQIVFH